MDKKITQTIESLESLLPNSEYNSKCAVEQITNEGFYHFLNHIQHRNITSNYLKYTSWQTFDNKKAFLFPFNKYYTYNKDMQTSLFDVAEQGNATQDPVVWWLDGR